MPLTIKGSISKALVRQLIILTSEKLSQSLAISLLNFKLDSGFDLNSRARQERGLIAGLFIKRNRFTNNLQSRKSSEDATKKQAEEQVEEVSLGQ